MKYKIIFSRDCLIHKGHFYFVGQKVKVNTKFLLEQHRKIKNTDNEKYVNYLNSISKTIFTIKWISNYPDNGVVLVEFMHMLEIDNLILIKN